LEFLIDDIFVELGRHIFNISSGTNCVLLVDLFLCTVCLSFRGFLVIHVSTGTQLCVKKDMDPLDDPITYCETMQSEMHILKFERVQNVARVSKIKIHFKIHGLYLAKSHMEQINPYR
jgi:hypothetical protein